MIIKYESRLGKRENESEATAMSVFCNNIFAHMWSAKMESKRNCQLFPLRSNDEMIAMHPSKESKLALSTSGLVGCGLFVIA
jgi:hypothetical protein